MAVFNWSVHPRWRGEHLSGKRLDFCAVGSSPLARGTHDPGVIQCGTWRFIPAGAGNTRSTPLRT